MSTRTAVSILAGVIVLGILFAAVRMGTPEPAAQNALGAPGDFAIRVPMDYSVDESYEYEGLGPGKEIAGTKLTIGTSTAAGTNLAPDTYLSVEKIPSAPSCIAELFLNNATGRVVADAGVTYSVASSTGAAAGNRYEETVYALAGTNPCIAVRYVIHYGEFENHLPGTVRPFDKEALLATFDTIRRTLIVSP